MTLDALVRQLASGAILDPDVDAREAPEGGWSDGVRREPPRVDPGWPFTVTEEDAANSERAQALYSPHRRRARYLLAHGGDS